MQLIRHCASLLVGVALVNLPFAQPAALGEKSVAEWAPEDAFVFVGIPDCDGLTEAYKKTQMYKSFEDPAMKETMQPWKKLLENAREYVAGQIGMDNPKDLEIWPHGGVALFLEIEPPAGEGNEEEVQLGLVADMGPDADRARSIAAKVVEHCLQKGAERTIDEVAGTQITTVRFKSTGEGDGNAALDDAAGLESLLEEVELEPVQLMMVQGVLEELTAPESFAFAFADSRLVLGSNTTMVRDTLVRMRRGAEESLAAVGDVRAFGRRQSEKPDALVVFNLPVLTQAIAREDEESKKIIAALSADALGPIVLGVQVAPSREVDLHVRGFMRIDSRPHGLGRILQMKNIDTAPPSGVSADTAFYASMNLDPPLVLEEVLAISQQIDPETAEQIASSLIVPQEDGSTLDIKSDVVGQLTGPLTFGLNLAKPFGPDQINMILRLGHKSRDAMTKLAAMLPPGMLMPDEMLGHTVYTTPMLSGMAMGFTEQAVIPFATHKALEGYIRSEGQSGRGLAQTRGFRRAVRHVPGQSCAMVFADGPLITDAQIAMAEDQTELDPESGQPSLSTYIRFGMGQGVASEDTDILRATRKYQSYLMATVSSESDGLAFNVIQVPAGDGSDE